MHTKTKLFWRILAAAFALVAVAGCAGSSDERRTAALGEGEAAALSWQGDWTAEKEYQEGSVVTHEGATFVAVTPAPTQAPDARCDIADCAWSVMADGGQALNTAPPPPPPPPKIQVFEYETGYDGPVELPTPQFVGINDIQAELQRWQQAVNDWLADIAPHVIRHRDDSGTLVAQKVVDPGGGGSYLVFARGVLVSVPGLGKAPLPQGPNFAALVSGGFSIGSLVKSPLSNIGGKLMTALRGPGVSEYSVACKLTGNFEQLDQASMSLTETGTASFSLMAFYAAPADVGFRVGCAHNGAKAGPFVRDLRLVAVKLD